MSSTYSDVDASGDPAGAVAWQDRVDGWPQIAAYKRRIVELLARARDERDAGRASISLLDVGCGPGSDVLALGADRCAGVDRSWQMCSAAAGRGATVVRADVERLPFPDGLLAGVAADRVVQHVERPEIALRELVRVLRPGGRLVVADPDQETLVIHVPGVRHELVDRIKALRRDRGYRNGRFVTTLPSILPRLGVAEVTIEAFPLSLTDPRRAFGVPGWARYWRDAGPFSARDIDEWETALAPPCPGFLYALLYFVVSGVRAG